jgi:hypothetical protein
LNVAAGWIGQRRGAGGTVRRSVSIQQLEGSARGLSRDGAAEVCQREPEVLAVVVEAVAPVPEYVPIWKSTQW